MEKEIKLGVLQDIYMNLFQNWDENKKGIELGPKSLYNLISLKKIVLSEMEKMQEAVQEFIKTLDGVSIKDDGTFNVPQELIPAVNGRLAEMNNEVITIDYKPIEVNEETDKLPIEVMDVLFDFIEVK